MIKQDTLNNQSHFKLDLKGGIKMCKENEEKVYSLTEQGDFGCGATELSKEDADKVKEQQKDKQ